MTRITTQPTRSRLLMRLALRSARRKTAKMTGRETARMLEPLEAYAHTPGLLMGYGALELATARADRVEHRLKELTALKAATIVECEYCIDIGSTIGRRSGITDEQLLALPRHRESGLFSEVDMLALDLADAMTRTPVRVPDELYDALREHFDEDQLVELIANIALENMRSRFNAAFEIGAAGFSEGLVCAIPDAAGNAAIGEPANTPREPLPASA